MIVGRVAGPPRDPVAIVGAGVVAAAGASVPELWAALLRGASTSERYVDDRLPPDAAVLVARAAVEPPDWLSPIERRRLDRVHLLALVAARQALDEYSTELPPPDRCGVVCGVGLGAGGSFEREHEKLLRDGARAVSPLVIPTVMPSSLAATLSLRFGFTGPVLTVSTACASGTTAIGEACELLRRRAADLVLAGGADALLTFAAVTGFLRLDAMSRNLAEPALASRPFDVDRDGFVLGEGAAFVVLVRSSDAGALGRPVRAQVLGYGASADAYHLVAPDPSGRGALSCMRAALHDAGVASSDISQVNAHATSTVAGDRAEASALAQLFPSGTPPVTAVKGTTGHAVAASGAIEAVVTAESLRHRLVPPTAGLRRLDPACPVDAVHGEPRSVPPGAALSVSFGFGGANAALVLAPA